MLRAAVHCRTVIELFVPGRLCLFGEHSDWAAGYRRTHPQIAKGACLVAGTDQGLSARVSVADHLEIQTVLPDGSELGPERFPLEPDELVRAATDGRFFSYAVGTACVMLRRFGIGGARISIERHDLPVQKGLSSSAAVCVLVARALGRLYGLGLDERAEMELAYVGERLAGSECGRMDQVCAFGRRVSLLVFDGEALEVEPIVPGAPLHLLIVDLRRGKDTRRILRDLNACYPDTPGPVAEAVRAALGAFNADMAKRARTALEAGDAETLGACMEDAQRRFDSTIAPACPELRAPQLRAVLELARRSGLSWGGKGVGSQGDGSAQLVARGAEERDALTAALRDRFGVTPLPLTLGL